MKERRLFLFLEPKELLLAAISKNSPLSVQSLPQISTHINIMQIHLENIKFIGLGYVIIKIYTYI